MFPLVCFWGNLPVDWFDKLIKTFINTKQIKKSNMERLMILALVNSLSNTFTQIIFSKNTEHIHEILYIAQCVNTQNQHLNYEIATKVCECWQNMNSNKKYSFTHGSIQSKSAFHLGEAYQTGGWFTFVFSFFSSSVFKPSTIILLSEPLFNF